MTASEDVPTDLKSRWRLPIGLDRIHEPLCAAGFRILFYGDSGIAWARRSSNGAIYDLAMFSAIPDKEVVVKSDTAISVVKWQHFRSLAEYQMLELPYHPKERRDYSTIRGDSEAMVWEQAFVTESLFKITSLHRHKEAALNERTKQHVEYAEKILGLITTLDNFESSFNDFKLLSSEMELKMAESVLEKEPILKSWYGVRLARLVVLAAIVGSRVSFSTSDTYSRLLNGDMDTRTLIRILGDRFTRNIWYLTSLKEGKYHARRYSNGTWIPCVLE